MRISPVQASELAEALAILRGDDPTAPATPPTAAGEADPNDVLVARTDGICGAIFARKLPGAVGVVGPARTLHGDPAIEDALHAAALRRLQGVKVVQAFVSPHEIGRGDSLLRAGFRRATRVLEMRKLMSGASAGAGQVTLVPYAADATAFQQILVRCHENTLDCPEIHGLLTADELLEGYRDCAPELAQWWLAKSAGEYVGAIILAGQTLAFVGVVPERRGQGIGRAMIRAATELSPELTLIVDERNAPAIQLYASAGFAVVGSREVFLNFFPSSLPPSQRKSSGPGH